MNNLDGIVELVSMHPFKSQIIIYPNGEVDTQYLHIVYKIKDEDNKENKDE